MEVALTASRSIPARAHVSASVGRRLRAEIEQDLAAQYTALTGEEYFALAHNVDYSLKVTEKKSDTPMAVTSGTLVIMLPEITEPAAAIVDEVLA